jgi:hypothetical protein
MVRIPKRDCARIISDMNLKSNNMFITYPLYDLPPNVWTCALRIKLKSSHANRFTLHLRHRLLESRICMNDALF